MPENTNGERFVDRDLGKRARDERRAAPVAGEAAVAGADEQPVPEIPEAAAQADTDTDTHSYRMTAAYPGGPQNIAIYD
jgi:hypothetical protein